MSETGEERPNSPPATPLPPRGWWHGGALAAAALLLAVGLVLAIWLLARPLALLLAAIILADALAPLATRLERRLPRTVAVGLTYGLLVLAIAGVGWVAVPRVADEASQVLANAPTLIGQVRGLIDGWTPAVGGAVVEPLGALLPQLGTTLVEIPLAVLEFAVQTVLVLAMSAYWSLASGDLRRYALTFVPRHLRDEAVSVAQEVVEPMGGYFRARALVAVVVAAVVYAGLRLIGVEYPLALALLAGLGELIPYLGPTVAAVPALVVALTASPGRAVAVLIFVIVVQQLKGYILMPAVVRWHGRIPPLLVIFALVVGTSAGGVLGAVVAPPLAGALRVVLLRVLTPPACRWADRTPFGADHSRGTGR